MKTLSILLLLCAAAACRADYCEDDCSACSSCEISCCDSNCNSKCNDSCCLQCCDKWTVVAEILFLNRGDSDDYTLITDQNTGAELLNVSNFDFDHRVAPRFFLIHDRCDCWGFEVGVLGVDSWSVSESHPPVSPTLFGPGNTPFVSAGPGTVFQANYGTDFYSGEFNLRRRTSECITWLAGFRWIELEDRLSAGLVAPTVQNLYTIDTRNQMYGFQIGAETRLVTGPRRVHLDGIFKAGVLFNDIDQSTRVPVLPANVAVGDDHTTFLGEIGLRAVYQLRDHVTITTGYHMIWLDGVALAPDQIPVTNVVTPALSTLDTGGTLFLHGATIGATFSF